jgi:type I restriction enzyme S subunit
MKAAWKEYRLSDCATLLSGGTPSKSRNDYWQGDLPWVSCKDMKVDRIYDAEDHLSHLGAENGTRVVPENTILFVVRGMILAKAFPVAITKRPVAFNQDLKAVTCADFVEPEFLYYWLKANSYEILGRADEAGHGTKRLQTDRLLSLPIRVPPLFVQRRMADILSAYDDLIENNQRRIKILEEMARSLYREWFVHFRFPGHEKVKIVPSTLGSIPPGWEGSFGDLVQIDRDGINPFEFPGEKFEHFSIPSFDNGRQATIELGETILSGKYCIDTSCVLLSKLNPRIPRIWLPAPSGQRRAVTSTEFLVLKPRPGFTREFIYSKCCSEEFAGQFASLAIGTSTSHQRVKPENLLTMPSTVPDRLLVDRFSSAVAPMFILSQQLQTKTQNLRRTRDLLLPRLLSGQIDVANGHP